MQRGTSSGRARHSALAILSDRRISRRSRICCHIYLACFVTRRYTRVIKYGGLGVDLARPADQDLYLTQLPSYEYRDLVAIYDQLDRHDFPRAVYNLCSLISLTLSRVRRIPRGPISSARLTKFAHYRYSRDLRSGSRSRTHPRHGLAQSKSTTCGLSTIARCRSANSSLRARASRLPSSIASSIPGNRAKL